jgi:hypothetical protein
MQHDGESNFTVRLTKQTTEDGKTQIVDVGQVQVFCFRIGFIPDNERVQPAFTENDHVRGVTELYSDIMAMSLHGEKVMD